jgi:uridine kinase
MQLEKASLPRALLSRSRSAVPELAVINADGWLNLPHVRFHRRDSARHFYENAIRFDEMFERVILPLRTTRNINAESDFAEETATTFRKHRYAFRNKVPEIVTERSGEHYGFDD